MSNLDEMGCWDEMDGWGGLMGGGDEMNDWGEMDAWNDVVREMGF